MLASVENNPHIYFVGTDGFSFINFRLGLVKELRKAGYTVSVALFNASEDELAVIKGVCVNVSLLSADAYSVNVFSFLRLVKQMRSVLISDSPDVVFSYFAKPNIMVLVACLGKPLIRRISLIEGLGVIFDPESRQLRYRVLRALYLMILRTSDCLIVLNEDDKALLQRYLKHSKIRLVDGIGVNLKKFRYTPRRTRKVGDLTFIMVARLLKSKGVEVYYNAALALKDRYPKCRFLLLGGESYSVDRVSDTVLTSLRDGRVVTWVGHVDPKSYLKRADVFVLPSYYMEGLPRSILEALAMGLPIVTTDWRGCRETVDEGVNGFLIRPHSVEALVEAMASFVSAPIKVAMMGAASRHVAEIRFSEEKINSQFLLVIKDVLDYKKKGIN